MSKIGDRLRTVNPEQLASLLRTLLQVLGGVAATYGVMTENEWATLSGPVLTIIITVWGMWARSDANLIKSAESVPAVRAIIAPGTAVASNANHPKVVNAPSDVVSIPGQHR